MPAAYDVNDLTTEITKRARDAAYVAVGLGVLGLQRAQAVREDLARAADADPRIGRLRAGVATGAEQVVGWVEGTLERVDAQLRPIEVQLPEPAREIAGKARARVQAVGEQLRQVVAPGA